jgi:tetratricopeptide (TPR) repeat protein
MNYQLLGQSAAAEAMYTGAIAASSVPPSRLFGLRGQVRIGQRKLKLAEADATKAIELSPEDGGPYLNYGWLLRQTGKYPEALAMYDKAVSLAPYSWWAKRSRANLYHQLGDYEKAIQDFTTNIESLLTLADQNKSITSAKLVRMYIYRAYAYASLGQSENARADIEGALSHKTTTSGPQREIAWFLATCGDAAIRNADQALALAHQTLQQADEAGVLATPLGAKFWSTLGVAQYRSGDWQAAITSFDRAYRLEQLEQHIVPYGFFVAMSHWQLGDKDEARNWYNRTTRLAPMYIDDWQIAGFRVEAAEVLGIEIPKEAVRTNTKTENE